MSLKALLLVTFLAGQAVDANVSTLKIDSHLAQSPVDVLRTEEFALHVKHYGLDFSVGDYDARLRIFSANLASIERHNADEKRTYTQGVNQFTHLTHEEYKAYVGRGAPKGPMPKELAEMHARMPVHTAPEGYTERRKLQGGSTDWRNGLSGTAVVMPPKDQGQCGSCWTFSSAGALESAYVLYGGANNLKPLATASTQSSNGFYGFSEQSLVDCAKINSNGCDGGFPESGYMYAAQIGGVITEKAYPYTSGATTKTGICMSPQPAVFQNTVINTQFPWTNVAPRDIVALQSAVDAQPVAITINGGANAFQSYKSGIIMADDCSASTDHAVLLVGYGTDTTKSQPIDYWIIKNSYGTSWGLSGYAYVQKSAQNACGIMEQPSFPNFMGNTAPLSPPTFAPTPAVNNKYTFNTLSSTQNAVQQVQQSFNRAQQVSIVCADVNIAANSVSGVSAAISQSGVRFSYFPMLTFNSQTVALYVGAVQDQTSKVVVVVVLAVEVNTPTHGVSGQQIGISYGGAAYTDSPVDLTSSTLDQLSLAAITCPNQSCFLKSGVTVSKAVVTMLSDSDAPPAPTAYTPVPSVITSTTIMTTSSSSDCSAVTAEVHIANGLCFSGEDGGYSQTVASPPVTNYDPASQYTVSFNNQLFTDANCQTPSGDPGPYQSVINKCMLADGINLKYGFNVNADKKMTPPPSSQISMVVFSSMTACQALDYSQAGYSLSSMPGACNPFLNGVVSCSGTNIALAEYPDSGCTGVSTSVSVPSNTCFPQQDGTAVYYTGCGVSTTTSSGGGLTQAAKIGIGVGVSVVVLAFILYFYFARSATATATAAAAAANPIAKDIKNPMAATAKQ